MRLTITTHDGTVYGLRQEPARAHVLYAACPHCKAVPFYVAGSGKAIGPDDRHFYATGHCVDCSEVVGIIRAYPNTIFGLTEDHAMLNGRPRVY